MGNSNLPNTELLKAVLEPLLDDFQYWFDYAYHLFENERMEFISNQEQSDLLFRIKQVQAELNPTKLLFRATDGQVGVDMAVLRPWHQLVSECWNVGTQFRKSKEK
jgi:hypothetical protein